MPQCEGTTRDGSRCKKQCSTGTRCHVHTGDSCPICMTTITPGTSRTLECGHTFHKACLERWKRRSSTCPNCRAPFDQLMYKVRIFIDPIGYEREMTTSNIQGITDMFGLENMSGLVSSTTISFAISDVDELRNILNEIGFSGVNFASLDTEG